MTTTIDPITTEKQGRVKRPEVVYFHDGKAVPTVHCNLANIASIYTRGIDGDAKRIGTAALADLLGTLGVTDPRAAGWMVMLPNGVTLECREPGEKSQYDGPAPTRKASKAPAAKKPAKPSARVKKETAKARAAEKATKTTTAKQVTPIPKGTSAPRRSSSRAN